MSGPVAGDANQAGSTSSAGEVDSKPVHLGAQRILDTFHQARPVRIADAAGLRNAAVRVTGRAAAGPGGVLRAPLSGVECVWYRSVVVHHLRSSWLSRGPAPHPFPAIAPSDLAYDALTATYGLSGQRFGSDRSSTASFVIDDGTGTMLVDPSISDMDSDVLAVNAVVVMDDPARATNAAGFGGGPFDQQEVHAEWVIPVGAALLAVGTVTDVDGTPALVGGHDDVVVVSTKPEQQILSRNHAAVHPSAPHLLLSNPRSIYLLIGLVLAIAIVIALLVL